MTLLSIAIIKFDYLKIEAKEKVSIFLLKKKGNLKIFAMKSFMRFDDEFVVLTGLCSSF